MKSILTLCINLLILIISDAVAVKLIEGEHTIVKKDGATHNISKYYVVPNDYDPNKNTNSNTTKTSKRRTLQMNHSLYSKSMDSGVRNKDQVSEVKAENNKTNENNDVDSNTSKNNVAINNTKVSFRSDQNDTQVEVQDGDYTAETMESMGTEHNLEGDGFTSLLVEPLNRSINISSNVTVDARETDNTLNNKTRIIVENATETSEANLDDLIFTNFGISVYELSTQNIKSFWKLVKLNVERTSNKTELFAKLDRLTLLLSIFTNLYQVAQSQKPFESIIDSIIYILQNPCVEKRNTIESQSEMVSGRNSKDPHSTSNGTNLIELEGRKPSPQVTTSSLELENPDFQERLAGDSNNAYKLSKPYYDDRRSNDTDPITDLYNSKVGTPQGYNVSSTISSPALHHVARENTQEDSESNQSFSDSSQTDKEQVDLPVIIESKLSTIHPLPNEFGVTKQWIIENKSPDSRVEGVVESKSLESSISEPWVSADKSPESRIGANQPLSITSSELAGDEQITESSFADYQSLTTVSGKFGDQPTTESSMSDYQPATTASRMVVDRPLTIEFRSTDDQPLTNSLGMAENQSLSTESDLSEDQRLATESRFTNDQSLSTVSGMPEGKQGLTKFGITDQPLTTETRLPRDIALTTVSGMVEDQPLTPESRSVSDHQLTTVSVMPEDKPMSTESSLVSDHPLTIASGIPEDKPLTTKLKNTDNEPLTTASRLVNDHPLSTEWRISDDQPLITESETDEDLPLATDSRATKPLITEDKWSENLPSTFPSLRIGDPRQIEEQIPDNLPWHIKYKRTHELPWHIKNRMPDKLPWHIEDRTSDKLPWHIEDKISDKLPWYIEDRTSDKLPWRIEDRTSDKLPWYIEDRTSDKLPWHIEDRTSDKLPWYIEDRTSDKQPWHIEDRSSDKLPWYIEDRTSDRLPWHIEDRTSESQVPWTIIHKTTSIPWIIEDRSNNNVPWNIKYNKIDQSPAKLYQSSGPDITTYNGKILLDPKQPSIVNRVKQTVTKPYQIYMYVIKPKTTLYEMRTTDEIANLKNEKPNSNLKTNSHSLSTSHSGKKVLSNYITSDYDKRNEVNPSHLLSDSPQNNNEPKYYVVGPEIRSNPKPELLLTSEQNTNSDEDDNGSQTSPQYPIYISQTNSELTLPNEYHNPTVAKSEILDQHPGLMYMVPYHPKNTNTTVVNYEEPQIVDDKYKDHRPELALQSAYTIILDDYDEPTLISGENTPQHPSFISHASDHAEVSTSNKNHNLNATYSQDIDQDPEHIYSAENYKEPKPIDSEYTEEHTGFVPNITHQPEHIFALDDDDEPTSASGENTPQHPGYKSHASVHSEFTNIPNDYNTANIHQHIDFGPMVPYHPEYSSSEENYEEPNPDNDENTDPHPGSVVKLPHPQEYTNELEDYDEPTPVGGENTPQHPGYISHASIHSEFTNTPTDYNSADIHQDNDFGPMVPYHPEYSNLVEKYQEPTPVDSEYTEEHTGFVPEITHQPEYTLHDDDDEPIPVSGENTPQNPGYVSHASIHSKFTNVPNDYNSANVYQDHDFGPMVPYHPEYTNSVEKYEEPNPVNDEHTDPHPGSAGIPHPQEYTNELEDYDEPTPVSGENTPQHPSYISHVSAHSEYSIPSEYHNPKGTSSENMDQLPDLIAKVPHESEYTNVLDDYDEPTSASENTPQYPGYIYHASAHSDVTIPHEYNNPRPDNGKNVYTHAVSTQNVPHTPEYINIQEEYSKRIPVHSVETVLHPDGNGEDINTIPNWIRNGPYYLKLKDILNEDITRPTLVDGEHAVHTVQPSFVAYLHSKKPKKISYLKKKKMPQTYQLFTLGNVLQLHDAVIKAIQLSKGDDSDYRALINLSKIVKLILVVAEQLNEPEGRNEWYKKIFLNADENRHPLQLYVYNLIRQRWLHELMLILLKKNFDTHILQNPRIFHFLGSWKFPNYVQRFLDEEDFIKNVLDDEKLNDLQEKYSTDKYDGLENYVTNKVIQSYQVPNDDLIVSIAGVEAEPEAHAIISILKQYMHYKNIIKNQENVIIRHIKLAMLKKITLVLKQKGYPRNTISDLIRKLHSAVYLTEGQECQPHHPQFMKNMFDIILPVLRRSGH